MPKSKSRWQGPLCQIRTPPRYPELSPQEVSNPNFTNTSPKLDLLVTLTRIFSSSFILGRMAKTNFKLPNFQVSDTCQFNATLPLQQQLTLLLPGAWACRPDLIPRDPVLWSYDQMQVDSNDMDDRTDTCPPPRDAVSYTK